MKNHLSYALCICITLFSLCATAQSQGLRSSDPNKIKPKLFQSLPESITIKADDLTTLINTPVGNAVNISLSDFHLEGQVVSASNAEKSNVQTVVIRSSNYTGARLTLSKITKTDGTISYSGRMLSFQHGDLLELKNQDGHYILIKRKLNDLISE